MPNEFHGKHGTYTVINMIGQGGNGQVFKVTLNGKDYALKTMQPPKGQKKSRWAKRYKRFLQEITILSSLKLSGIPPVIDSGKNFYVMPLATLAADHMKEHKPAEIIAEFASLSQTLIELEKAGYAHRDIKPQNLLVIDNEICLADFGLAKHTSNPPKDLSGNEKKIGPLWTMAPEMRRNPKSANLNKADVYSFAKTLWIFLTGKKTCFEGQFSGQTIGGIAELKLPAPSMIEELLTACTANKAKDRPTHEKIFSSLKDWLEESKNEHLASKIEWNYISKRLFTSNPPTHCEWNGKKDILSVLQTITSRGIKNHTFLPNGGGLDLINVHDSNEDGCIELVFDYPYICRPKKLIYENINDSEIIYFLLELKNLSPCSPESSIFREMLTELSPLKYTDGRCIIYNDFNGQDLPKTSRGVGRFLKGKLAIFWTSEKYTNARFTTQSGKIIDSYDAIHEMLPPNEFRTLIERFTSPALIPHNNSSPQYITPTNFKFKQRLLTNHELVDLYLVKTKLSQIIRHSHDDKSSKGHINLGDISANDIIKSMNENFIWTDFYDQLHIDTKQLLTAVCLQGKENITGPFGKPLTEWLNNPGVNLDYLKQKNFWTIHRWLEKGINNYT
jgi:serine/threonine-protein kinase